MNYYAVMLKKKKLYVISMHREDFLTLASSKKRAASSKERAACSLKLYQLLQKKKYTSMTLRVFT